MNDISKFDKVGVLSTHMDNKVNRMILDGLDLDGIISTLQKSCNKFNEVINTTNQVDMRFKYLYTHNAVAKKLIEDIYYMKKLQNLYSEFNSYNTKKIISLIKFRNKAMGHKIEVEIPEKL